MSALWGAVLSGHGSRVSLHGVATASPFRPAERLEYHFALALVAVVDGAAVNVCLALFNLCPRLAAVGARRTSWACS